MEYLPNKEGISKAHLFRLFTQSWDKLSTITWLVKAAPIRRRFWFPRQLHMHLHREIWMKERRVITGSLWSCLWNCRPTSKKVWSQRRNFLDNTKTQMKSWVTTHYKFFMIFLSTWSTTYISTQHKTYHLVSRVFQGHPMVSVSMEWSPKVCMLSFHHF